MNVAAHQKKKNEKAGKKENRRPILKRLRVELLRPIEEQHGEKMVCVRGVAGETGTKEQQLFRPDPNEVGDRTTTLRWLFIGAALLVPRKKSGSNN